ncbi:glycosyltransferase family 9 protein [Ignavibacterium sp.]|uniref:glycosyltransferase family 9 protein n=1 Tax=Ignavibacterium sp. TaxID=2651167 RepID=UPI00307E6A51
MKTNINPLEIKKILCIKPRGIGDIILSTIILENLHSYFHNAEIHYLTEEFAKDAVSSHPLVTKVLSYKKDDSIFSIFRLIRKEKYDIVFDLYSNPKTAQITFFSGAKFRIGYAYRGRKYAYNNKSEIGRGDSHSAEHNLELLKALEIPIISKTIKFFLTINAENFANSFVNKEIKLNNIIGIIPSGGWDSKRCPKERWVQIINELSEKLEAAFLILWGPEDLNDAQYILNQTKNSFLAPETDLMKLAGLISRCRLVITNDSGPMHLSAALRVPTLGLFGPTDPMKHGPYSEYGNYVIKSDLQCIRCNKLICPFNKECFNELDIDEIISKSIKLLTLNVKKI